MKATICVGISGSGKSTWAIGASAFRKCIVVCKDDLRWKLSGKKGWQEYRFDRDIEKRVRNLCTLEIENAAKEGWDIVIANQNLHRPRLEGLAQKLKKLGYEVVIKEFPVSFQEALRRDKERGIYAVGEDVLKKQWEMWVAYWKPEWEKTA